MTLSLHHKGNITLTGHKYTIAKKTIKCFPLLLLCESLQIWRSYNLQVLKKCCCQPRLKLGSYKNGACESLGMEAQHYGGSCWSG